MLRIATHLGQGMRSSTRRRPVGSLASRFWRTFISECIVTSAQPDLGRWVAVQSRALCLCQSSDAEAR